MAWLWDILTGNPRYQDRNCWEWADELRDAKDRPWRQEQCRAAFQALGPRAAKALLALFVKKHDGKHFDAAVLAEEMLAAIGPELLPLLVDNVLRAPDADTRSGCARALQRLGENGWCYFRERVAGGAGVAAAAEKYLELVQAPTVLDPWFIAAGLAHLGSDVIPSLRRAVAADQRERRRTAVLALGLLGRSSAAALSALVEVTASNPPDLETQLSEAWKNAGPQMVQVALQRQRMGPLENPLLQRLVALCDQDEAARRSLWLWTAEAVPAARAPALALFQQLQQSPPPTELVAALVGPRDDLRHLALQILPCYGTCAEDALPNLNKVVLEHGPDHAVAQQVHDAICRECQKKSALEQECKKSELIKQLESSLFDHDNCWNRLHGSERMTPMWDYACKGQLGDAERDIKESGEKLYHLGGDDC